MKKFLLLTLLAFVFTACSTDDSSTAWEDNATVSNVNMKDMFSDENPCFAGVGPGLTIDLADGIDNPVLVFKADLKGSNTRENRRMKFLLSVEMQLLADCEDINVPQGTIVKITNPNYYTLLNDTVKPTMSLLPSQMLTGCYRWRLVMDGYTMDGEPTCSSTSRWKDAPVY